jgi:hypothetical protein
MTRPSVEPSPQTYARLGGLIYLLIIVFGAFGELAVRGRLIVPGNAAATANSIAASPLLFRAGIAGDLLMHVCDVPLTLIFYRLLLPVSRDLSLLAAFFNLVQTAALVANKIGLLTVVALVRGSQALRGMDSQQLQTLAWVFLMQHDAGFGVGLIFFGFRCLVVGYLVIRSRYLPPWLGWLQLAAGAGYLINSTALLLAPVFAHRLFPAILLPPFLGELAMCLWLLIRGVDMQAWRERQVSSVASAA